MCFFKVDHTQETLLCFASQGGICSAVATFGRYDPVTWQKVPKSKVLAPLRVQSIMVVKSSREELEGAAGDITFMVRKQRETNAACSVPISFSLGCSPWNERRYPHLGRAFLPQFTQS